MPLAFGPRILKRWAVVMAMCTGLGVLPSTAHANQKISGNDWILLEHREKMDLVNQAMDEFERMGVLVSYTPDVYAEIVDDFLAEYPELLAEPIGSVFATVIYMADERAQGSIDHQRLAFPNQNLKSTDDLYSSD